MSTVNYVNPSLDRTVRIFDEFYKYNINVNENEYDVVYAFFKTVFAEELAAKNFTMSLFYVADQTKTSVLDLLADMQSQISSSSGQPQIYVQTTMAYYLNNLRSNSTLLGVSAPVVPNYYAARNVLP